MFNCVFVTFPCRILGQVWYLIVSIPELCQLSYFQKRNLRLKILSKKSVGYYNDSGPSYSNWKIIVQIVQDQITPVKEEQSDQGFCLFSSANNLLLTWMDLHE